MRILCHCHHICSRRPNICAYFRWSDVTTSLEEILPFIVPFELRLGHNDALTAVALEPGPALPQQVTIEGSYICVRIPRPSSSGLRIYGIYVSIRASETGFSAGGLIGSFSPAQALAEGTLVNTPISFEGNMVPGELAEEEKNPGAYFRGKILQKIGQGNKHGQYGADTHPVRKDVMSAIRLACSSACDRLRRERSLWPTEGSLVGGAAAQPEVAACCSVEDSVGTASILLQKHATQARTVGTVTVIDASDASKRFVSIARQTPSAMRVNRVPLACLPIELQALARAAVKGAFIVPPLVYQQFFTLVYVSGISGVQPRRPMYTQATLDAATEAAAAVAEGRVTIAEAYAKPESLGLWVVGHAGQPDESETPSNLGLPSCEGVVSVQKDGTLTVDFVIGSRISEATLPASKGEPYIPALAIKLHQASPSAPQPFLVALAPPFLLGSGKPEAAAAAPASVGSSPSSLTAPAAAAASAPPVPALPSSSSASAAKVAGAAACAVVKPARKATGSKGASKLSAASSSAATAAPSSGGRAAAPIGTVTTTGSAGAAASRAGTGGKRKRETMEMEGPVPVAAAAATAASAPASAAPAAAVPVQVAPVAGLGDIHSGDAVSDSDARPSKLLRGPSPALPSSTSSGDVILGDQSQDKLVSAVASARKELVIKITAALGRAAKRVDDDAAAAMLETCRMAQINEERYRSRNINGADLPSPASLSESALDYTTLQPKRTEVGRQRAGPPPFTNYYANR